MSTKLTLLSAQKTKKTKHWTSKVTKNSIKPSKQCFQQMSSVKLCEASKELWLSPFSMVCSENKASSSRSHASFLLKTQPSSCSWTRWTVTSSTRLHSSTLLILLKKIQMSARELCLLLTVKTHQTLLQWRRCLRSLMLLECLLPRCKLSAIKKSFSPPKKNTGSSSSKCESIWINHSPSESWNQPYSLSEALHYEGLGCTSLFQVESLYKGQERQGTLSVAWLPYG